MDISSLHILSEIWFWFNDFGTFLPLKSKFACMSKQSANCKHRFKEIVADLIHVFGLDQHKILLHNRKLLRLDFGNANNNTVQFYKIIGVFSNLITKLRVMKICSRKGYHQLCLTILGLKYGYFSFPFSFFRWLPLKVFYNFWVELVIHKYLFSCS